MAHHQREQPDVLARVQPLVSFAALGSAVQVRALSHAPAAPSGHRLHLVQVLAPALGLRRSVERLHELLHTPRVPLKHLVPVLLAVRAGDRNRRRQQRLAQGQPLLRVERLATLLEAGVFELHELVFRYRLGGALAHFLVQLAQLGCTARREQELRRLERARRNVHETELVGLVDLAFVALGIDNRPAGAARGRNLVRALGQQHILGILVAVQVQQPPANVLVIHPAFLCRVAFLHDVVDVASPERVSRLRSLCVVTRGRDRR